VHRKSEISLDTDKKDISSFGLPPMHVNKTKQKRWVDLQYEHVRLQLWCGQAAQWCKWVDKTRATEP